MFCCVKMFNAPKALFPIHVTFKAESNCWCIFITQLVQDS